MRQVICAVAAAFALLAMSATTSYAANGNVSRSTLAQMGLSSLQVVSDVQGEQVRGMGWSYASASGSGFVVLYSHGSLAVGDYDYSAVGSNGAGGAGFVGAGQISGGYWGISGSAVIVGGASSAYAY